MTTAAQVRKIFLDFFASQGHTIVPSASLIPADDPTLFFTNAGMVPFKNVFLGSERRDYVRATTTQKCLRVQGKHNDLEEVGRTPRHHTFFEMLGNFSFGDYFKAEAIDFAWELLTQHYKIPAERLVATVFLDDDEAEELWTKHLPKDRIFRLGEKDNFWSMGDTGPCGPCTELHYDWHPERGAVVEEDLENGRFWEIWNLVFMQYNRDASGTMTALAKPSIDTGMGLERLVAVLQNHQSNYDTDLFTPVIAQMSALCGVPLGAADKSDVSLRVVADHIRSTCFLIADGVLPSNEGRGYVLRRIMRRAIRHGKMLGLDAPFLFKVATVLIAEMGAAFPELTQNQAFIETVIEKEEERFYETLANGLQLLHEGFVELSQTNTTQLPGALAFQLYDTFGFPMDLTQDIAEEHGFTVDTDGFTSCMEKQREQARAAWKGSGGEGVDAVYSTLQQEGLTTKFCGFSKDQCKSVVRALIVDGARVEAAPVGADVSVVTKCSPFYAEGGGQVGDRGTIASGKSRVQIHDTTKPFPDVWIHRGQVEGESIRVGDEVVMDVDVARRTQIRKHHTATHLLHKALREHLGDHVKQAGSLVTDTRLRFDFSHFEAVSDDVLQRVEQDVNTVVQRNIALDIQEQSKDEAIARGAMAFFGEKYGDTVRVVDVPGYSIELCGGTHVEATGEIGLIKLISESSVAAGVRRIEAVAGAAALECVRALDHGQREAARLLKVSPSDVAARIKKLQDQVKQLERDVSAAKSQAASGGDWQQAVTEVNGASVLAQVIDDIDPKALRGLAEEYRNKLGSGVVALGSAREGKASVIVMVSKDLTDRYAAGAIVKSLCEQLGGKGGGRPDMAQGGGPNVAALPDAIAALPKFLC